ncbi:MAG: hypothetical protein JSW72_02315 [Candidatus Bathyarchaeota archaeon]|nr:MAG: hypothetical protein JSW72_02315 [Candidatus Bathyarchaeota archaeon]
MKRKAIAGIIMTLFLASMSFNLMPAICSPTAEVHVDPSEVLGVSIGSTFDIYVTVSDVVDLFLADFSLSWDPALLETAVGNINTGDTAPYLEYIYVETVDNLYGELYVAVGRPPGVSEMLSGTVQLAKITFLVEAEGSCDLHIFDTTLLEIDVVHIEHTTKDGYFSNVSGIPSVPELSISIPAITSVAAAIVIFARRKLRVHPNK